MNRCIVYTSGSADTDFNGMAYSNMDSVLCYNDEKKEFFISSDQAKAHRFESEDLAKKAIESYCKNNFHSRFINFELSFLV